MCFTCRLDSHDVAARVEISPHLIFYSFLEMISFDHQVVLDLLISNETNLLEYLTRYLKLTLNERGALVKHLTEAGHLFCGTSFLPDCPFRKTSKWQPSQTKNDSPAEISQSLHFSSGTELLHRKDQESSSADKKYPNENSQQLPRLCDYSDSENSDNEFSSDIWDLEVTSPDLFNVNIISPSVDFYCDEKIGGNNRHFSENAILPASEKLHNCIMSTEIIMTSHTKPSNVLSCDMFEYKYMMSKKFDLLRMHSMRPGYEVPLRSLPEFNCAVHLIINMLKNLNISLERLVRRQLFPYNAKPLCKLLESVTGT